MPVLEDTFIGSLAAVRAAASALPTSVGAVRDLSDSSLIAFQAELAEARRALDASASLIAGEIEHRSRPELGYTGLAQREGYRTPEKLVQHLTGSTARDASTLVHVGTLVHEADAALLNTPLGELREPWLTAVGLSVASGGLGVDAAQAIRSGLGVPTEAVTAAQLEAAVGTLLELAAHLHADQLFKRARELRDELDLANVADRERQLHQERAFRRVRRPNGLPRYIIDPDIESAALWDDLYDTMTAPRRGVRFVNDADQNWADAVAADQRTTEQYVHDAVTELLRIAIATDSASTRGLIGSHQPAVRVLVTVDALERRAGKGHIEGAELPVSIATVERIACTAGTVPIAFDDNGQALNLGRTQRTFTDRQRTVLAARDGGCMFGDCDRPPGWCEAHHIAHWQRDHGPTDLDNGILLCKHHHLLVHNNGWEIEHRRNADGGHDGYWLIPPADVDPERMPRPMPSKSAALRDLRPR